MKRRGLLKGALATGLVGVPAAASASLQPGDVLSTLKRTAHRGPPEVLWTWTTREQLDELKADPTLLSREDRAGVASAYASALARHSAADDPTAARLAKPMFAKHRYAWTVPWATFAGFAAEHYGDVLLRLTLAPAYEPLTFRPWQTPAFQGSLGDPAGPVLHVHAPDKPQLHTPGTFATDPQGPRSLVREYVVCDPSSIVRWEAGTPAVVDMLRVCVDTTRALAAAFTDDPVDHRAWVTEVEQQWKVDAPEPSTLREAYVHNLALCSALYLPQRWAMNQLADQLAAIVPPAAVQHPA